MSVIRLGAGARGSVRLRWNEAHTAGTALLFMKPLRQVSSLIEIGPEELGTRREVLGGRIVAMINTNRERVASTIQRRLVTIFGACACSGL